LVFQFDFFFFKIVYLNCNHDVIEIKREKIELGMNSGDLGSGKQHNTFDFMLNNQHVQNPLDMNNINYSNQMQQSYLSNQQYAYGANSYKM